jgi:hypothetical protein
MQRNGMSIMQNLIVSLPPSCDGLEREPLDDRLHKD